MVWELDFAYTIQFQGFQWTPTSGRHDTRVHAVRSQDGSQAGCRGRCTAASAASPIRATCCLGIARPRSWRASQHVNCPGVHSRDVWRASVNYSTACLNYRTAALLRYFPSFIYTPEERAITCPTEQTNSQETEPPEAATSWHSAPPSTCSIARLLDLVPRTRPHTSDFAAVRLWQVTRSHAHPQIASQKTRAATCVLAPRVTGI